jgi:ATP-dependent Lon protease
MFTSTKKQRLAQCVAPTLVLHYLDIDFNTKNFLLKKVKQIEEYTSSSDSAKFKTWIDNFLLLPINKYNHLPINLNDSNTDKIKYLKKCNDILDLSIYGHKQPKDNILRILAQWINKPDAYGNCIALQGPMGNGKTTLVRNGICKAMDRPFGFISLGGCSDSSYLVGHDFTYEGSLYGKIAQILIECKCMNPIIYFDELDKISEDLKGKEIVNALIHITDNSQNSTFEDKYFSGIKLDLSKVLFVFSYNNEDLIDPILKDRLTIIKTNGYNLEDKVKIGHQFLITEQINKMGLNSDDIIFDDESLKYIINNFTKEEGVRDLKRCIEKIISKINLLLLLNNDYTNINVDYKLDVLEIPFKLSTKIIDKLLKNDNIVDDNISRRMMYL